MKLLTKEQIDWLKKAENYELHKTFKDKIVRATVELSVPISISLNDFLCESFGDDYSDFSDEEIQEAINSSIETRMMEFVQEDFWSYARINNPLIFDTKVNNANK